METTLHVLITGASSGIGAALARRFCRAGATVTGVARRRPLLESLARELGPSFGFVEADLAQDATGCIAQAVKARGPIDVLVNNAGIQAAGPFVLSDRRLGDRLLAVDLLAPLALTRAVLPLMMERGEGAIVNVSSVAAFVAPPGMARYAAAKAGLAGFSEALRAELGKSGVHVLTVYPGPIDNGAPQETHDLYGRGGVAGRLPVASADALAKEILVALERRRGRLIFPRIYALARWLGPLARWLVDRATPALERLPSTPPAPSLPGAAARTDGTARAS